MSRPLLGSATRSDQPRRTAAEPSGLSAVRGMATYLNNAVFLKVTRLAFRVQYPQPLRSAVPRLLPILTALPLFSLKRVSTVLIINECLINYLSVEGYIFTGTLIIVSMNTKEKPISDYMSVSDGLVYICQWDSHCKKWQDSCRVPDRSCLASFKHYVQPLNNMLIETCD